MTEKKFKCLGTLSKNFEQIMRMLGSIRKKKKWKTDGYWCGHKRADGRYN